MVNLVAAFAFFLVNILSILVPELWLSPEESIDIVAFLNLASK